MNRTIPNLWLALALGVLAAGCSKDAPNLPTDSTAALDRGRSEDEGDDDDRPVTYAVIGDVP